MVRDIVHSKLLLRQPSEPATPADASVGQDLLDTLAAHADECVGMAANMIGARKRVIVFHDEATGTDVIMYNPRIMRRTGEYTATEGCLSLPGVREATRWRTITVEFDDKGFRHRTRSYSGWTAQIIQHEIDHCDGILI